MARAKKQDAEISVLEVSRGTITCCVKGITPLICEAMPIKVQGGLLAGGKKKTASEKHAEMKHDPLSEYRLSVYKCMNGTGPTRILMKAVSFKCALADVAIDLPGARKAPIGRNVSAYGETRKDYVDIYGIPKLRMDVVRCADINHTPDIRTRACLEEWACKVLLTFTKPVLNETVVVNLLAAAGVMRGIGGYRPEKGKGDYGQFEIVSQDDPDFMRLLKMGRAAQDAALENPAYYNNEAEELMEMYCADAARRGIKNVSSEALSRRAR